MSPLRLFLSGAAIAAGAGALAAILFFIAEQDPAALEAFRVFW